MDRYTIAMTDLSQLSDEEVDVRLCELLGWKWKKDDFDETMWWFLSPEHVKKFLPEFIFDKGDWTRSHVYRSKLPNYSGDQNECAKVFRSLAMGLGRCERFDEILKSIVERDFRKREAASDPTLLVCDLFATHATARQWAESLIQLLEEIATLQP